MEYYCCELNHSKYCPETNGGKCWARILEERDPKEYRKDKRPDFPHVITVEETVEVLERLRGHVDEETLSICIKAIQRIVPRPNKKPEPKEELTYPVIVEKPKCAVRKRK